MEAKIDELRAIIGVTGDREATHDKLVECVEASREADRLLLNLGLLSKLNFWERELLHTTLEQLALQIRSNIESRHIDWDLAFAGLYTIEGLYTIAENDNDLHRLYRLLL